jgi:hypothetical protein
LRHLEPYNSCRWLHSLFSICMKRNSLSVAVACDDHRLAVAGGQDAQPTAAVCCLSCADALELKVVLHLSMRFS